jgi:hypothetical protein
VADIELEIGLVFVFVAAGLPVDDDIMIFGLAVDAVDAGTDLDAAAGPGRERLAFGPAFFSLERGWASTPFSNSAIASS